ncbi:hypothetical protein NDU88_005661 [Pleurodeles waltl]|uniref:Uncharacterized protein n=1 Tax=Pleurodeles waltl TaxID=8319 RepID=A0AAV7WBM6_PLEWA|nr:hypothetical protein NDU88_005661 [Pleurodeles waltl]
MRAAVPRGEDLPGSVGARHEHPQERWRDVQCPRPSNRSGGPVDLEAGDAPNEGRALAQVVSGPVGAPR